MIDEMLAFNKQFVAEKRYERYAADKYPNKKIAILTCMDTRLVELLPAALGLKNGDVKIIKNHTDCGVQHIDAEMMIGHMLQRGVPQDHIDLMKYCGIDFARWLSGFDTVEQSVTDTVDTIRHHPLIPADVRVGGYVMDTVTGELAVVCPAE